MSVTDQQPGAERPAGETRARRSRTGSPPTPSPPGATTSGSSPPSPAALPSAASGWPRACSTATVTARRARPPRRSASLGGLLPGESIAFRYPGEEDRAVAVRLDDGTLVGYSAVCTHLACAVLWRKDRGTEGELYCPCHEGVFDARSGEVTAGPPPRGLPKVVVIEQDDGSVWAVGTTRSGESIEGGLCRQLGGDRPDLASRIGCPDIGGGAESPPRADSGTESGRRATGPADGPGRRAGGTPATAENPGRRA